MIGLDAIEDTLTYTLFTGYLQGERPLSVLLVAAVESGKTEAAAQFDCNTGVLYLTDFTACGLVKKYLPQMSRGEIKHIIVPDLMVPLSKSRETTSSTIAFLSAFMEEGVKEVVTYNFRNGLELPEPVRGGVIAAIATADLNNRKKDWGQAGFISRFLPFSYSYGMGMIDQVLSGIVAGTPLSTNVELGFPNKPQNVDLPKEIGEEFKALARGMGAGLGIYGFRPLRHLIRLAKGRALSKGRTVVTSEDRDRILELVRYFNLSYSKLE